MRLWHKDLIPYLPRQQLLSQWRECICIAKSLADKGTPNHILVNRILYYPSWHFQKYGLDVVNEMRKRGYKPSYESCARFDGYIEQWANERKDKPKYWTPEIFEYWHNDDYLIQCFCNLKEKHTCGGIDDKEFGKVISFMKKKFPFNHAFVTFDFGGGR